MKDPFHAFMQQDVVLQSTGEGSLNQLTFAVKDVFAIKGYASSAGNPDWLRTHEPSEVTASSIERLLASGATMEGTTHTDELMYSINGQNDHYGTPINPAAVDRIPGGSSSGSAVAVAAGAVDFALGTDTGGSVRVPSAYCGIYGFRPTHDLVPIDGVIPLAPSYDTVGWMARNTSTLLKVGEVLLQQEQPPNEEPAASSTAFLRILLAEEAWAKAEASSRELLSGFIPAIEQAVNKQSRWLAIAPEGLEEWIKAFRTTQGLEIWETHSEWIEREKPMFGESIRDRFVFASTLKRDESTAQVDLWKEVRARMRELLGEDGLLVIPTIPGTAPSRDISGEENELRRFQAMQLSCIAGLSGLPQVTIPAGEVDGAPIGLSFIAGANQDLKLLRWTHQFIEGLQHQPKQPA